MARPLHFRLFLALLLAAAGGVVAWQHRATARLREELAGRRARADEVARLQEANARLQSDPIVPAERERRRAEREAWTALAGEIEAMRRRAAAGNAAAPPANLPRPAPRENPTTLRDGPLAAAQWRNVGQATPEAALETALWAAAGGDVRMLADSLIIDADTRAQAAAVFDRLPAMVRQDVGSAEGLVALLTAKHIPLGVAHIVDHLGTAPDEARLVTYVTETNGLSREVMLTLRARDDRWRLVVPQQAMTKYVAFLQGTAGEPTP
jgi:hypothetical protein